MPIPSFEGNWLILDTLFDHINDRKVLYSCCLVSSEFNNHVSPRLWSYLCFSNHNKRCLRNASHLSPLFQSTNLRNTRTLIVKGNDVDERGLSLLIEKLVNLTSVAIQKFDLSYPVIAALAKAPKLEALSLSIARHILHKNAGYHAYQGTEEYLLVRSSASPFTVRVRLPIFRQLKRLAVSEMFGVLDDWHDWLSRLLLECGDLTQLTLSKSDHIHDVFSFNPGSITPYNFFEHVCHTYKQKAQARLHLKSLRLASPIRFPDLATLSMLTDCTTLEDIYFSTFDLMHSNQAYTTPFDILLEQATPSLRRLFISDMTASFLDRQNKLFHSGVRRLSTFGTSYCNFSNFALGDPSGGMSLQILACLCYNVSIQQLSVAVESTCLKLWDFKGEKDLPRFCMYLGTMENLRVLWIIGNTLHKSSSSLDHIQQRNVMDVLRKLVAFCRLLNYIKIGNLAWRVVPAALGSECEFRAIDAREDEVDCPQSIYVPSPLPGAKFSGHSDWRLIDWNSSI